MRSVSSMSEKKCFSASGNNFLRALSGHRFMPFFKHKFDLDSASQKPIFLPGRCFASSSVISFLKWLGLSRFFCLSSLYDIFSILQNRFLYVYGGCTYLLNTFKNAHKKDRIILTLYKSTVYE